MRKKSLAVLHCAALILAVFTIAVGAVVLLPGGKALVVTHFEAVRAVSHLGWAAGLAVLGWGAALAAGLGRISWAAVRRSFGDADLVRVRRALLVAAAGNAAALAGSPVGLALGDRYTWPVYVAHVTVSLAVVAATSFFCLVRLRAFVDDVAPAPLPIPARTGFIEPTGF